jgi:hypothetical protein
MEIDMANNSGNGVFGFVVGALLGASLALSDDDYRYMRATSSDWNRFDARERATRLRSYARNVYATVRDTPRDLENQRSQTDKAVRLAREANRLAPSIVGSRAVIALERVRADLSASYGRLPLRVPAVDIS